MVLAMRRRCQYPGCNIGDGGGAYVTMEGLLTQESVLKDLELHIAMAHSAPPHRGQCISWCQSMREFLRFLDCSFCTCPTWTGQIEEPNCQSTLAPTLTRTMPIHGSVLHCSTLGCGCLWYKRDPRNAQAKLIITSVPCSSKTSSILQAKQPVPLERPTSAITNLAVSAETFNHKDEAANTPSTPPENTKDPLECHRETIVELGVLLKPSLHRYEDVEGEDDDGYLQPHSPNLDSLYDDPNGDDFSTDESNAENLEDQVGSPAPNYDVPYSWYSNPDLEEEDELAISDITTEKESNNLDSSSMDQDDNNKKVIYENENKDETYENSICASQPPPVPKRNMPMKYQPQLPPRQNHMSKSKLCMVKSKAASELQIATENCSQSKC